MTFMQFKDLSVCLCEHLNMFMCCHLCLCAARSENAVTLHNNELCDALFLYRRGKRLAHGWRWDVEFCFRQTHTYIYMENGTVSNEHGLHYYNIIYIIKWCTTHTHHTQCSVVTARNVRVGVGGEVIRLVGALHIIITLRLSLSATKSSASQKS